MIIRLLIVCLIMISPLAKAKVTNEIAILQTQAVNTSYKPLKPKHNKDNNKVCQLIKKSQTDNKKSYRFACKTDDSYKIDYIVHGYRDLDGDGTMDMIADEKLSVDGINKYISSNTLLLMMDKQHKLKTTHSINISSQWLYYLDNFAIKGNTVTFTAHSAMDSSVMKYPLQFLFKNSKPYEQSYLTKCRLATMSNKNIFKNTLADIERHSTIATDYTQEQSETLSTAYGTIDASLYGCDNPTISIVADNMPMDRLLAILVKDSRFSSLFQQAQKHYQKGTIKKGKNIALANGWHISFNKDISNGKKHSHIYAEKIINKKQSQSQWRNLWHRIVRLR